MLINLYGNIVNPANIIAVTLSTNDGYAVYFNGIVNATSSLEKNYIEISAEAVQTVDGLGYHTPSLIYMMDMINQLSSLGKTSAKEINKDGSTKDNT